MARYYTISQMALIGKLLAQFAEKLLFGKPSTGGSTLTLCKFERGLGAGNAFCKLERFQRFLCEVYPLFEELLSCR
jgi:hypothetical protein